MDTEAETQVDAAQEQQDQAQAEKGEKTAENVRYGQAISESGFGGKTTEDSGGANQGAYLTEGAVFRRPLYDWDSL